MKSSGTLPSAAQASTGASLTAADRCDRCGAQAYLRLELPYGELLFCAHHAREHRDKIQELDNARIQDETSRLKA